MLRACEYQILQTAIHDLQPWKRWWDRIFAHDGKVQAALAHSLDRFTTPLGDQLERGPAQ
jgi:hypothetical protein